MRKKANLLLAIKRAQAPGACSYRAGCVIAKLADIEDPTGELRARLRSACAGSIREDKCPIGIMQCLGFDIGPLAQYDLYLLSELQYMWDAGCLAGEEAALRSSMAQLVEAW